ncbi:hypothetical protein CBR_g6735 [Chara braunii]|uniref:RING-type domain-containing protein n=1 Tax=Chara braunii TaxID=69332 RepID=A0A388KKT5_CHABU|nr:hypothetical protein CBR_g6735 [Chara braunii]|eukprot:GBG70608.1 hypothetical protein CBR_g6735 [Chara braunii]
MARCHRFHNDPADPAMQFSELGGATNKVPRGPLRKELCLEPIFSEWICCLCADLLHDPVSIFPCQHEVCAACFASHCYSSSSMSVTSGRCPVKGCTNWHISGSVPARDTATRIAALRVRCPNGLSFDVTEYRYRRISARGSQPMPSYAAVPGQSLFSPPGWGGGGGFPPAAVYGMPGPAPEGGAGAPPAVCREDITFATLEEHLQVCGFALQVCRNKAYGCTKVVMRQEVIAHDQQCEWRLVACASCSTRVPLAEMEEHRRTFCLSSIIPCEYKDLGCDLSLPRIDMPAHVQACVFKYSEVQTLLKEFEKEKRCFEETLNNARQETSGFQAQFDYYSRKILEVKAEIQSMASA